MNDLKPFLETILELGDPWLIDDITLDQEQVRIDIYLDFRKGGTFSCPLCGTSGCKVYDSTMKKLEAHESLPVQGLSPLAP